MTLEGKDVVAYADGIVVAKFAACKTDSIMGQNRHLVVVIIEQTQFFVRKEPLHVVIVNLRLPNSHAPSAGITLDISSQRKTDGLVTETDSNQFCLLACSPLNPFKQVFNPGQLRIGALVAARNQVNIFG